MELKEYIRESIAIAMIVLGIVILISLLTYSPEDYSDDYPFPSMLVADINKTKPLHVVVSYDESSSQSYIITAYIPDIKYFEKDLITRKENYGK